MTVNRTTLLDLPLPVTGTESGTWGDTTNNGLTQYLDIAIAGTLVLSTDADVTLTSTEGDSSATNIGATTAQYAILRWTATGSTTRNITALAQSKTYVVINATGGTQSIVLRGAGPTTGVTIISGEKAHCVWNGSDFVKVSSSAAAGGSNTQVQYNSSGVLAGSSNLTFDGTSLTLGGNPTLSAGTANGVLYLNGSKVATSGSALTFDGTNFFLNTGYMSFNNNGFIRADSANNKLTFQAGSSGYLWKDNNNSGDWMALTSTGLGIGTSSPSVKLDVTGSGRFNSSGEALTIGASALAANAAQYFRNTSGYGVLAIPSASDQYLTGVVAGDFIIGSNAKSLRFGNAGTGSLQATLDSSGNLGLGVTPSAWIAYKAFQIGQDGSVFADAGSSEMTVGQNVRYDGAFKYITAQAAGRYRLYNGSHTWFTAPSGTAGNAITFTQAMTLDASGNLGVGTTSPADAQLTTVVSVNAASGYCGFRVLSNGTAVGRVVGSAGNEFRIDSLSTNPLTFYTNGTERARITSGGDLQISSGGSLQVGGTAARATTAGTNRVDIFNGTAPVGTLTNGISLYSSSGEAYVMDAAGNATLFSPHDAETNEWVFKSKHTPTGKVLKIDVEKLLRFVNDHFGLDAVHEFIES